MRWGSVFEELIRKFAELSNETAGEHFTPREVIRLMVNLLFIEDDDALTKPGVVRSIYDPTAGTGGMLSVAGEHLAGPEPRRPRSSCIGQELNAESYAICKADMLIKGQDIANIIFGNTLPERRPSHRDSSTTCSPIRRSAWSGRRSRRKSARSRGAGLQRPLRSRPAARQRRLAAVPAAPDLQDAPARTAAAASASSSTARRCSPAARAPARAKSAATCWRTTGRSHHRPADRHVLQHRHQHLRLDRHQPQARPTARARCKLIDASGFWQKMRKSLGSKRELSARRISTTSAHCTPTALHLNKPKTAPQQSRAFATDASEASRTHHRRTAAQAPVLVTE